MMSRELRRVGYRVPTANHGAEALNHCLHEDRNNQPVISDLRSR